MKAKDKRSGCSVRITRIYDNPTVMVRDANGEETFRKLKELDISNQAIDLNDTVRVTLTKAGAAQLNKKNYHLQEQKVKRDKWCSGDTYTATLWWLMKTFADSCVAGNDRVFIGMEAV